MSSTSQYDVFFNSNIHKILTVQGNMSYGTSENSYKKYDIFSSIIKAKWYIYCMHTQEIRTKIEKDESWEAVGSQLSQVIFGDNADRWRVTTVHHLIRIYHYFLDLLWLLPLCHILIWQAQSPTVTQPMPLQVGRSARLSPFSDWEHKKALEWLRKQNDEGQS